MPTNDRESANSPAEVEAHLPVDDLSPAAIDAKTAEQIKGGLGQLRNMAAQSSSAANSGTGESSK